MRFLPILLALWTVAAWSQANRGELRFSVADPSGAGLRATIVLDSQANHFHKALETDRAGHLTFTMVPFGEYEVDVTRSGFATFHSTVDLHSNIPQDQHIHLSLGDVETEIRVSDQNTLLDLHSASTADQIGSAQIKNRLSSLPGRSIQDLIVSQPGWLYEGNAVLHPRGAEYQTQFVLDGIPFTENRSPSFGPEIEANDLESISIYTAGFPAEYGRKMGGVVELNTHRQTDPGTHGEFVVSGGSYDTLSGYGRLQETGKGTSFTLAASGSRTNHYLNPVVPENYTNTGTTGSFSAIYEHDLNSADRLTLSARHELSRYLIPNELVQQAAGQLQNGGNFESVGTIHFQHVVSPESLLLFSAMLRDNSKDLASYRNPTPIAAFQHNRFREGYFKATYSLHQGRHEFKMGLESDTTFLHENSRYSITDPSRFDPNTAPSLIFSAHRPDLEQSAFFEDVIRIQDWTVSAGLRWDHYQLLLNRQALSPRITVSRAFPSEALLLHASYDRVFQTPSFDNVLLSSSPQISAVNSDFLRLPVQPSTGSDFEAGAAQGLAKTVRLDVTAYWRRARNFADDDQLLNTGISYPIAFDRGSTYGAEGKLQVVNAGPVNGFVSYSYMVAKEWFPVTGGLFLGSEAQNAASDLKGHFPATQDQRNTLATRWEYALNSRLKLAAGASFGSGLPFAYGGTREEALAQYGPAVINRLNFERGRILPQFALNSSVITGVFHHDRIESTLHIDGENLTNRLNVLDFGGLFSGNAIAPARSVMLRWETTF